MNMSMAQLGEMKATMYVECLDMLADGEIDILGNVSYTPERAESIDYSTYAAGTERYWIYTREDHTDLMDGDPKQMNGCRIGVADGSYQKELLEKWLDSNQIQAEVVVCKGYDEMIEKLDADERCTEGVGGGEPVSGGPDHRPAYPVQRGYLRHGRG